MKNVVKLLSLSALGLYAGLSMAEIPTSDPMDLAPAFLVAHNNTPDMEANAYLGGTASPYPIQPKSTLQLPWFMLLMACSGRIENDWCTGSVKVGTNTPHPVDMGEMKVNIKTGDLEPRELHKDGYSIYLNKAGEVTLSKD